MADIFGGVPESKEERNEREQMEQRWHDVWRASDELDHWRKRAEQAEDRLRYGIMLIRDGFFNEAIFEMSRLLDGDAEFEFYQRDRFEKTGQ